MTPSSVIDSPPAQHAWGDEFRTLMSEFPGGVAVVTTLEPDGAPSGTACTALAGVTQDPPTLLVCLDNGDPTLAALRRIGCFAVNLLHEAGSRAAEDFGARIPDRFARTRWRPGRGLGLPWLAEDTLAYAECLVSATHLVGDHTIVIGRVCDTIRTQGTPLLHGGRRSPLARGAEPFDGGPRRGI